MHISASRYQYEVDTFVWNFLLPIVAVGLSMTSIFTMMSDQLLGTGPMLKMMVLMPQVMGSATVFALQLALMIGIHVLASPSSYRVKSNIVLGVALVQFLCVCHNFTVFIKLLPDLASNDLRQIDYFYWVLSVGLGFWLVLAMSNYVGKVRGFWPPRAETE
jgi:hypothetical protein